jgi:hypothetical protein
VNNVGQYLVLTKILAEHDKQPLKKNLTHWCTIGWVGSCIAFTLIDLFYFADDYVVKFMNIWLMIATVMYSYAAES